MNKISFSEFRRTLHHKKVKFTWTSSNGKKIKTFETEKFYSNRYGSDSISMPQFLIGKKQEWSKIDENTFKSQSMHGKIIYEIMEEKTQ